MHGTPMVMLLVAVCVTVIVLRIVTLQKDREADAEDARLLGNLQNKLIGLERRVRNLETLLADRQRRDFADDEHNDRIE